MGLTTSRQRMRLHIPAVLVTTPNHVVPFITIIAGALAIDLERHMNETVGRAISHVGRRI